jgi:dihydroflavonol-4-reductase
MMAIKNLSLALMEQSILVTGGTGLLGSHLLVQLARDGKYVKAIYRKKSSISEIEKLFKFYKIEDKWHLISWIEADISDTDSILDHMNGVQQIYHCAALVSFNPADSDKLYNANIVGTRNIVNLALEFEINKLVYVSSTAAIGRNGLDDEISEETRWVASLENTFYAKSKHLAEQEVWRSAEEGLDVAIVNPCIIIGPGSLDRSTGTMFSQVLNGLKYYTNGANAFVDVRDVVDIMIQLMHSNITGQRYLTIAENRTFKEVFTMIADKMEMVPPSKYASKLLIGIAWRFEKLRSVITRTDPRITSETARASHRVSRYSNQKIISALNVKFSPLDSAIKNTVNYIHFNQRVSKL